MRMPPPTPNAPDSSPPAAPTSARRTHGRRAGAAGAAGEVTRPTVPARAGWGGVRPPGRRASPRRRTRPRRGGRRPGGRRAKRSRRARRRVERGERRLASHHCGIQRIEAAHRCHGRRPAHHAGDEHEQHAEHGAARVHHEVARVGDAVELGHLHQFDEGREGEAGDERERPPAAGDEQRGEQPDGHEQRHVEGHLGQVPRGPRDLGGPRVGVQDAAVELVAAGAPRRRAHRHPQHDGCVGEGDESQGAAVHPTILLRFPMSTLASSPHVCRSSRANWGRSLIRERPTGASRVDHPIRSRSDRDWCAAARDPLG